MTECCEKECCEKALQRRLKRCGVCRHWLVPHLVGETSPLYGKTGDQHPAFGYHHTDDTKATMAEAHRIDGRVCDYPRWLYTCWYDMMYRCHWHPEPCYGGRGIQVCEEWHDPLVFFAYVMQLPRYGEPGYTLNRIDNDGNYEPGNIEWADKRTQAQNRRPARRRYVD